MPTEPVGAPLGPYRFLADPAQAAAYARETGGCGQSVPLCYVAAWLSEPAVRNVITEYCVAEGALPMHESQTFVYETPLQAGESYDVTVRFFREITPPRLILDATIATLAGAEAARVETVMRIVPREKFESMQS